MRRPLSRLPAMLLCTTALIFGSSAHAAFDPNADVSGNSLPDTSVLYDDGNNHNARPLYPQRVNMPLLPVAPAPVLPSATIAPMPPTPMQVSVPIPAPQPVAISAPPSAPLVTPAVTPVQPAQPSPVAYEPTVTAPPITAYQPASTPAPQEGFIAPAPVFAEQAPVIAAPLPPQPAAMAAIAAPSVPPVPPTQPLSPQTQTILSHIPSHLDTVAPKPTRKVTVSRANPEIKNVLDKDMKDAAYEATGISIKVRRPGLDANYELNRAYTALMGGDTEAAIGIYKDILNADPSNQDALFGLAATYHRLGEPDKARPYYGALLKINPNHREGLNNFLAMVSDESPQEALAELERLEQRNPDFSPIPAQEAIVLSKLGYANEARDKMLRAIELSPDNLTYKYNLAVMLDGRGDYANAGPLYTQLIKASMEGQKVPGTAEAMQKRLNFITLATNPQANGG